MSLAMTKSEREDFLAGPHVGVISIQRENRGPLSVPIWYGYEPGGEIRIWSGGTSTKVKLLKRAGRFSLCAQQETLPYKYVSVEGPVVGMEPIDFDRELRPLVYRYLGPEEGDRYLEEFGGRAAMTAQVLIRMCPEHWFSEDHSK